MAKSKSKLRNITLDKVVSFTEARNNLSTLVDTLPKEGYLVVTKRLKPALVLVGPEYFEESEAARRQIEREERFDRVLKPLREGFSKYLKRRGLDPKKLSDERVMKIIEEDAKS